jgi:hypothetical protein
LHKTWRNSMNYNNNECYKAQAWWSRPIGDPCSKSESRWKVDFAFFNLKPFSNVINFGMYLLYYSNHLWSSPIYIIIRVFKLLLQVYIFFFSKSNYSNDVLLIFELSCILVHIFWNLNSLIMTMLNLSKVSFSLCRFEVWKT